MKVLITGDVHGRFKWFNQLINLQSPDLTICCGEFGYWPNQNWMDIKTLHAKNPIYWIDGNHEDFYLLNRRISDEIVPNVFYKPRGFTEVINGKRFLFLGGGFSIDYKFRTVGFDYFPDDELLKWHELDKIPKKTKIDYVISHTAPERFVVFDDERDYQFPDVSRVILDDVLIGIKPSKWWFAHFHKYKKGFYEYKNDTGCEWTCLNMIDDNFGYEVIEV